MGKVEICGLDTATLPKINSKECDELILKIKDGDESAKDLFLRANMRLVLSCVGRFSKSQESADDLFQVGMVGLLKSLQNFDVNLGVRFSTYAVPMIIGETCNPRQNDDKSVKKHARRCLSRVESKRRTLKTQRKRPEYD